MNPRSDATPDARPIVCVVDDDAGLRDGLTSLFESIGLRVVPFASPAEFLRARLEDSPSCLVLDVRLPGVSGLDFQTELSRNNVNVPIIFITGHGDIPMSVRAMKAGAIEFLTKPLREQDLLDAVQAGIDRDRNQRQSERSLFALRDRYGLLTLREQEVMSYVTSGLMNKQVAAELEVSVITVKLHRGNVMRKMGARSLAELVRMADALGVRKPPKP
jgi:FixJ family two-component response regulator